jgi:prepilin-type N-terminal cleavage/methylation domain-containing protein
MKSSSRGFSMIEVVVALGVLTVAVLGLAGVMAAGMRQLNTSPSEVIAAQKAAQAIEAVYAARDSHKLTWDRIRNVHGESGSDNGVFLDGDQPLHGEGSDGLVNTSDDTAGVENTILPGPDGALGTADDRHLALDNFTREIRIRNVSGEGGQLRSITVIIGFTVGSLRQTYTLTTFISAYV